MSNLISSGKLLVYDDNFLSFLYPLADTTLIATPLSTTSLKLEWELPIDVNIDNVEVWESINGIDFNVLIILGVVNEYEITGFTESTTRYYKIRYKLIDESDWGLGVRATVTTFSNSAQTYFDAMDIQLPSNQKVVINNAIVTTNTQLDKLDCVMLSLATEQQSLLWINDPTKSGTKVNSPVLTPYKGWTGDTANYIDTGFNPGDGGTYHYQLNDSACISYFGKRFIHSNDLYLIRQGTSLVTSPTVSALVMGYYGYTSNTILARINNTTNLAFASNTQEPFIALSRTSDNDVIFDFSRYHVDITQNSSTIYNDTVRLSSQSNSPLVFAAFGSSLSAEEIITFHDAWLPVFEMLGSDYWSNYIPTIPTVTAGEDKIDLAWTLPVTTLSPYTVTNVVIQESIDKITFTDLITIENVESYSATVPTGNMRYYKIRYISSRGIETINSDDVYGIAGLLWDYTPDTLVVTPLSDINIKLDWSITGLEKTVTNIMIYHSTDDVAYKLLATLGGVETYTHENLDNDSLHYYKMCLVSEEYVSNESTSISGSTFITMAQTYFETMSEQLSSDQKIVINKAVSDTALEINKMDVVMLGLETEQQSLLWLNDPTKSGIKVNSPTFTAYKGWIGDTTNYVNTGFNPGDGGTYNMLKSNGTLLFYSNNNNIQRNSAMVGQQSTNAYYSIIVYTENNDLLRTLFSFARTTSSGGATGTIKNEFLGVRRNNISQISKVENKYMPVTTNSGGTTILNSTIKFALSNTRIPLLFIGSYLTDTQISNIEDSWLPVLEYLGSDYWSNYTPIIPTLMINSNSSIIINVTIPIIVTAYSPYIYQNTIIEHSLNGNTWEELVILNNSICGYEHSGLTNNSLHYYRYKQLNSRNINSNYSDITSIRVDIINDSSLVLFIDPSNVDSYPGTGNTVYDLSENEYNGTIENNISLGTLDNDYKYFSFTGDDNAINLGSNTPKLYAETGDFTWQSWVKWGDPVDHLRGLWSGNAQSGETGLGISLSQSQNKIGVEIYGTSGGRQVLETVNLSSDIIGIWNLVTVKIVKTDLKGYVYINASLIDTLSYVDWTSIDQSSGASIRIGSDTNSTITNTFDGLMSPIMVYDRALSDTELIQNFNITLNRFYSGYSDIVTDGLVLNLDAGYIQSYPKIGDTWRDLSTNKFVGTLKNNPTFSSLNGGILEFNGTNNYVEFGDILDLGTNDMSVSFWVKFNSLISNVAMMSKTKAAAQDYRFNMGIRSDYRFTAFMKGYASIDVSPITANQFTPDTWYNVCYIFDRDSNISIYVNTVIQTLTGSNTISQWAGQNFQSNNPFRIGSYTASDNITPTTLFDGFISDVKLYHKMLTRTEIVQNFYATVDRYYPDYPEYPEIITNGIVLNLDPGFIQSYPQTGTTLYDLSDNIYNGTLTGTIYYETENGGYFDLIETGNTITLGTITPKLYPGIKDYTWNGWLKFSGYTGVTREVWYGNATGGNTGFGIDLESITNRMRYEIYGTTGERQIKFISVASYLDQWHYYTFVIVQNTFQVIVYIDGNYIQTDNFVDWGSINHTGTVSLVIGTHVSSATWNYDGCIGPIHVYERTLDSAEILQNYNVHSSRFE